MQNNNLTWDYLWLQATDLMQTNSWARWAFLFISNLKCKQRFNAVPLKGFRPKPKTGPETNECSTLLPNHQPCTLMHPLYTPTHVGEFPLERQTQIIGHRFLLAGHKGTSYSPLCSCLLPILPSLLPTSCVPSNSFPHNHHCHQWTKSWAAPHPHNTAPFSATMKLSDTCLSWPWPGAPFQPPYAPRPQWHLRDLWICN